MQRLEEKRFLRTVPSWDMQVRSGSMRDRKWSPAAPAGPTAKAKSRSPSGGRGTRHSSPHAGKQLCKFLQENATRGMPAHGHTIHLLQHLPNAVAPMGATAEAEAAAEEKDVAEAGSRRGEKAKAGAEAPGTARVQEEKVRVLESLQTGSENHRGRRRYPKARDNKQRNLDDEARNADRETIRCSEDCTD